jgi:DNA processing protein
MWIPHMEIVRKVCRRILANDQGLFYRELLLDAASANVPKKSMLSLLRCDNIGPRTFRVLLDRHGSAGAALAAALPALIASGKAGRPIRIATVDEVAREVEATHQAGARFIGIGEPDYPSLLRRTPSPPPLIAVRGNVLSLRRSKIAIVGARNASAAGLAFTAQLARGIGWFGKNLPGRTRSLA